jgi:hypothetical protein
VAGHPLRDHLVVLDDQDVRHFPPQMMVIRRTNGGDGW